MLKTVYYLSLAAMVLILALGGVSRAAGKQRAVDAREAYVQADLRRGGLLYDKWYKVNDTELRGTHPLYPRAGRKKGPSSWRCKECHGWDYAGAAGRYRDGSHYTGIKGVLNSTGREPSELYDLLSGPVAHDFSPMIDEADRWSLVRFLREGLIDPARGIDGNGAGTGSPDRGGSLYETRCTACHGADGDRLDFKKKKEGVQGVGWLARRNPQESLHKIRWGHPGTKMPSMIVDAGLSDRETIDILTYSQGLGK